MKLSDKIIPSVMTIVIGVLFICFGKTIISIALTVIGVAMLIYAVSDLVNKQLVPAIVKAVIGLVVIVFGWVLFDIAIFILAIVLLISGGYQLYQRITEKGGASTWKYVGPAISVVVAICLLFNQGGTIAWMFTVVGILLIISGVMQLIECGAFKK